MKKKPHQNQDNYPHGGEDHQGGSETPEEKKYKVLGYRPGERTWEPSLNIVVRAENKDLAKKIAVSKLKKKGEDPGAYKLYIRPVADKSEKAEIKADTKGGWELLKDSFRLLVCRPLLLIPIFCSWVVYSSVVLWFHFSFEPEGFAEAVIVVFLLLFLISFTISMANIVMLTLVQQMEENRKISFKEALHEAFIEDSLKVLPISILWAVIWLVITILEAIVSGFDKKDKRAPSLKNAAVVLSGIDTPFSWFKLGLRLLEKAVRMAVFLSLPAIAWENKGPFSSFTKATEIIRKHPLSFLSAYGVTLGALILLSIPLIPYGIAYRAEIALPDIAWLFLIIYSGIIFILNIYLEQMVTGLLYLWHLKWEKAGAEGSICRVPKPELSRYLHEFDQMEILEKRD